MWQTSGTMLRLVPRLRLLFRPLRRPRVALRVVVLLILLSFLGEALRVLVGNNLHAVIPGEVYRCSQPTGDGLRGLVADHHIKTVINLRGYSPAADTDWYISEARATCATGISQEDITLSALRLPPPAELRRLVDVLDHSERPILFHCKQGADRTGMVSAMVLLLYTDADLARARRQLWPRYGHFRFGRVAAMDDFLDRYEAWLAGRPHGSELFRDWVLHHYSPGPASGALVLADGLPVDHRRAVAVGHWLALPVRATNTSAESWELKPGNFAGIHVAYSVQNGKGEDVYKAQVGLFRRTVRPGESLDLTLVVPPLKAPGLYTLRADLMDATGAAVPIRTTTFYQFGNDPLMAFIEAR
jgi:hypothetical protein